MNFKFFLQNYTLFAKSKYKLDIFSGMNYEELKKLILLLVGLNLITKKIVIKLER